MDYIFDNIIGSNVIGEVGKSTTILSNEPSTHKTVSTKLILVTQCDLEVNNTHKSYVTRIICNSVLNVYNSLHTLNSTVPVLINKIISYNSKHKVNSNYLKLTQVSDIFNSTHSLFYSNKYSADVNYNENTYLNTPFVSKYVETIYTEKFLSTSLF